MFLGLSLSELVAEQRADGSLKGLFELACPSFIQNDVLRRKWVPQGEHFVGESVYQVVVPSRFRSVVLQASRRHMTTF